MNNFNTAEKLRDYFNKIAPERDTWKKKNLYYYQELTKLHRFLTPEGLSILEIGNGTGDLLNDLEPKYGVGINYSERMIEIAREKYPRLKFFLMDAENLELEEKFDAIILSNAIGFFTDIWQVFRNLRKVSTNKTRVVISYYNYLWEPILKLGEKLGLKIPEYVQNWLPLEDIERFLGLNGFEVVQKGKRLLLPINIPIISAFINRFLSPLPILNNLCLIEYLVARKVFLPKAGDFTCSVIIPSYNEVENIENAVKRVPQMGKHTEIIFVEGPSTDGTTEKIQEVIAREKDKKDIKLIMQSEALGKGDAVRKGFAAATGEILMILDSDLTVAPEDLPKFYLALAEKRAEFVNGSRLVYPMEKEAMRFLNQLGNHFFRLAFSWVLKQRFTDTLCGTKALFKKDYEKIAENHTYFGDFDPFGDFDLIFGAAKLNLKISEVPVRYRARIYGKIKISRFQHGVLLFKMLIFALQRFIFW